MSNYNNYDDIQDRHMDTMIRLAYLQKEALETEDILKEVEKSDKENEQVHPDIAYQMFLDKLERETRKERKTKRLNEAKKAMSRLVLIGACVVLVIGIAAPIAIANIEAIRVRVMELLINIQDEYTEISMVENEEMAFDVPAAWRGEYYPSYIPDGFALTQINSRGSTAYFTETGGSRGIRFGEYSSDTYTNIDSEGAELTHATIGMADALVVKKDNTITVVWSLNNRYFVLRVDGSKEEALKIAENVKII